MKYKVGDLVEFSYSPFECIGKIVETDTGQFKDAMLIELPNEYKGQGHDGNGVYINRPHQKRGVVQKEMIQTLKTSCADVGVVVINPLKGTTDKSWQFEQQVYDSEGITRTVKAGGGSGNIPKVCETKTGHNSLRIRKLTPRECGRLMGVSDEDITKMLEVNSNSQCYKQFGNSIVVDVLYYIFKQMC